MLLVLYLVCADRLVVKLRRMAGAPGGSGRRRKTRRPGTARYRAGTASLRTYPVWRVSHPYRDGIAIRLIVWFPPDDPPVVILFANDKASMGDVFYDSVGTRADQIITAFLNQKGEK